MPAKPRWHADLETIRAAAASLPAPFLDRQTFERLFGLRRRQAQNLMSILGGYRAGASVLIGREELLAKLDELAQLRGSKGPKADCGTLMNQLWQQNSKCNSPGLSLHSNVNL